MPRTEIDIGLKLEHLQILDEVGRLDQALEPRIDAELLRRMYRGMVLTRLLDDRMIRMQRQGQMGTFAPGRGQEAIQIGSVVHLRKDDWYSPSYRSFGAQLWRGWTVDQLLLLWAGYFEGFGLPEGVNEMPMSIVIGSHVPVATGIAMAQKYLKRDSVVLTNFGDGASSEGDVSESLNFAAVFKSPILFLCENNQYAISMPVERQAAVKSLAQRGLGFGIPSLRVDGNDVLAMYVAMGEAVNRARAGGGPTFIEAATYRMEMHTTADDPKVYRKDDEVKAWEDRDPILRFEKYLLNKGVLDEAGKAAIQEDATEELRLGRERFDRRAKANPREIFDFMFDTLPPGLAEQKGEYFGKLRRNGVGE